ncbi:MAG: Gfo/Idh/MocA family oxidoreductase [Acidobacteria bacterium]|nr:Gfo/Idh/MocA family oxidoreductase [Acidobacteriota bacterium]
MIRIAVIGTGSWGRQHVRVLSVLPGVQLAGICDADLQNGQQVAAEFAARFFPDVAALGQEVDAAVVAVPTVHHHRVARQLLEAGVHVMVEKPLTLTLEEADSLIAAARQKGCLLHVGHLERFNPAVVALRPLVTRPQFFEAHRLSVFTPRSLDVDVVLDLMIHDLDIILSLVRSPIQQVHAVGIPILTDRIDIANARIEFENGCVANITASRVSAEKVRKLRFFQPNDYVSLDYARREVAIYSLVASADGLGREIVSRRLRPEPYEPLRAELESFVKAIRGEEPVGCSGEEGKAALAAALEILGTMRTASPRP